jgi:hypothetical protein
MIYKILGLVMMTPLIAFIWTAYDYSRDNISESNKWTALLFNLFFFI